eukprot:5656246-Pyramimonas_sp.AAC.1
MSGWDCGSCGYHNYGFRSRCRQAGCNGQGPKGAAMVPAPPPWQAPRGAWAFRSPAVFEPPRWKSEHGGKGKSGGSGQQQQSQPSFDAEQAQVWLEMSTAQFDAAAAVLSQSARDKLKHVRWKRENGFEGLVPVKEAKNVQQAIDSKAAELQRARSSFDKAKIAVQKATEQY